ncbi:hypothetical protein ACSGO4_000711 [Candidatus Pelagibacter ubique HIMB4]
MLAIPVILRRELDYITPRKELNLLEAGTGN